MTSETTQYLQVGYVAGAHSLKGEVFIRLQAGQADWLDQVPEFRLENSDAVQTLEVVSARPHKDGLIVAFKGVTDRNASEALKGYALKIPAKALQAATGDKPFLFELLGFFVHENNEVIGKVIRFESNGKQDLFVVEDSDGREHLIPFVKEFVEKMDFTNRTIAMHLPPGLLDI